LDGQQGEDLLAQVEITVNRNSVPFDPRPPMVTSGLRIGTPALATRGFSEEAFAEVAEIIAQALIAGASGDVSALPGLKDRVLALAEAHPLYPNLKKVAE
ncbi:serine hydroxymethyltransferase, partial [Arthrobacter sp. MYb222]